MNKRESLFFYKINKLLLFLSCLFFLISVLLIKNILFKKKSDDIQSINYVDKKEQINTTREPEFYDVFAPDIQIYDINRNKIILRELAGKVIVLRFTRFHLIDFHNMVFMEHLYGKYKENGISMFFINLLGMTTPDPVLGSFNLSVPIIEDDGFISSVFNAHLNDTIIIGKDFRIKFKNNQSENRIIHEQVFRYLFDNSAIPKHFSKGKRLSILKNIVFRNVKDGKIQTLREIINNKKVILNLSVSTCLSCPEQQRIKLLNAFYSKEEINNNFEIAFLFGTGNNYRLIKEFSEKNGLLDHFLVGVIEKIDTFPQYEYYQLFDLEVDPCLLILDNKNILYSETLSTQRKIDTEFIKKHIE